MRFANAVKGAAVLTVGLIVSGCAVRVRPAAVVVDPIPGPAIVVERPIVDVHVSRPVVVERKTVVVNPRPVVVEKKTTVVVNKPGGTTSTGGGTTTGGNDHHDNGNHYGQNKDKFSNPAARGDNGKGNDKKVAKNE
jgi:hypothetical protein